ncbi:MAG: IclR family transcriptional regulator [Phyllobacterium sp.]
MTVQKNGSVVKAFEILKLFSEQRPEINAADVRAELGLNAITAHRFLRTLETVGALVAVRKGLYRLSYVFVDLGERVTGGDRLGRILQPLLNRLTADMQEASMATMFQADMVVCIARAVSNRQISVDIRVGTQLEAYCTAHGKTWLAFMPARQKEHYLEVIERKKLTGNTLVDRETLEADLAQIRERRYAINDEEREDGIRAIAVPILLRSGRMAAGLSVFGPASRMSDEMLNKALEQLRKAADEASRLLYGPDLPPE